jgi:hypothetical protein
MVVKIPILILKPYDFTIMLALSDYEYIYNPIFVESGGIPILRLCLASTIKRTHINLLAI